MTASVLPQEVITLQTLINSGMVWHLEGSMGRSAMDALESGLCMLPERSFKDYWGNRVPARNELKDGTKGTEGNVQKHHGRRYLNMLRRVGDNPYDVSF